MIIYTISAAVLFLSTIALMQVGRRRRRIANRLLNLGSVSQQWLVVHRAEDR